MGVSPPGGWHRRHNFAPGLALKQRYHIRLKIEHHVPACRRSNGAHAGGRHS